MVKPLKKYYFRDHNDISFHFKPRPMRAIFTNLFFLLISIISNAQSHTWSRSWGGTNSETSSFITTDQEGSVYVSGPFLGSIDIDPGPDVNMLTSGGGGAWVDAFVFKLDSTGKLSWVFQLGSPTNHLLPQDIYFDEEGYVYALGLFSGTVDFDPGPDNHMVTSFNNSFDTYLLKLDPNGNFIQVTIIGGGPSFESGYVMTKDLNGDLIIAGNFGGTCDFDPGPNETKFTSLAVSDGFVAKYSEHGEFIWAKQFAGRTLTNARGIDTDTANNIYISGPMDNRVDFDPGPDSAIIQTAGAQDGYIVKLGPDGEFVWVRQIGSAGDDWVHAILVNDEGDLYAVGHFSLLIDFDPGPNEHALTAVNTDGYILKLNSRGEFIWVVQVGGDSIDQVRAITIDPNGGIYTTGWYAGSLDFDPGPSVYNLTSTGDNHLNDVFAYKLNADGSFGWAHTLGGDANDFGREIVFDATHHIFLTGSFEGMAGFNVIPEIVDSLQSVGKADLFLTRWSQCLTTYGSISPLSCGPFTSPSGNHVWTDSGIYQDTMLNRSGCDSVIAVMLEVINLDLDITLQDTKIVSLQGGANYQWVDCDNGFAPIAGAVFQSFEPEVTGSYAVIVEQQGCEDTSVCFQFVIISVNNVGLRNSIKIYPNPSGGTLKIEWNENFQEPELSIYDAAGRIMYASGSLNDFVFSKNFDFIPGLYLIEIRNKEKRLYYKWILQ